LGLLYEAIAIAAIVVGLALLVLRNSPAEMGLADHPENQARHAKTVPGTSEAALGPAVWRVRDILTSRAFWIPSFALATISGTCQAIVITLVPYGVQLGFTALSAALLISAFSTGAAVTKVAAGLLADYVNQRLLLIAACLFMMLSLLALSFPTGYAAIFASACLAGVSLGCTLPTAAALIAARFGAASFGSVMGWTYSLIGAFAILETRYAGTVFDRTGGYRPAFAAFFILSVAVVAAVILFGPEKAGKAHAA
jgi:MFS family permease